MAAAVDGLAKGPEVRGEIRRKIEHRLVTARLDLFRGSVPRVNRLARRRLGPGKLQLDEICLVGFGEQSIGEVSAVEQRRHVAKRRGADNQHPRRPLLHELCDLKHAHPQERIEQNRQHGDHEQRPPVAQLVAYLAGKDQLDVRESHEAAAKPWADAS